MTRSSKIRLVAPVALVCLLQALIPLVMMVALLVVKNEQKDYVARNPGNVKQFETIRIDRHSADARSFGGGELLYKGLIYDVSSVTIEDNDYVIIALPDRRETGIYKHLGVIDRSMEGFTSAELHPLPFYFLYYEPQNSWQVQYIRYSLQAFRPVQVTLSANIAMKIPKPPPRFLFSV